MTGRAVWKEVDECALAGSDTIALTTTIQGKKSFQSMSIVWTGGAAPTTSENLKMIVDRSASSGYDETLFDQDASTYGGGIINFRYDEGPVVLDVTDQIKVTYANTDDLAIECTVTTVPR